MSDIDGELSLNDLAPGDEPDDSAATLTRYTSAAGAYGAAAHLYLEAGWRGVLPLPEGAKLPPPDDYTGRHPDPSAAQVAEWVKTRGRGNIALRCPDDVIFLDVDNYGIKRGGATLIDMRNKYGPLPATWRCSARGPQSISGKYPFRVPPGLQWIGGLDDIEILQRGHRYCVAWPSVNNDAGGAIETWYDPSGAPVEAVPKVNELPALPEAYVAALAKAPSGERVKPAEMGSDAVRAWLDACRDTRGEPCGQMRSELESTIHALRSGARSRHDAALRGTRALVAFAGEGHGGITTALIALRETFLDEVTRARRGGIVRTADEAGFEWASMLTGAIKVAAAKHPVPAPGDPGTCVIWDEDWTGPVIKPKKTEVSMTARPKENIETSADNGAPAPVAIVAQRMGSMDEASAASDPSVPASGGQAELDTYVSSRPGRRNPLDVTSTAIAADWLRYSIGTGPLAGVFVRGDASQVVHCPSVGEEGYRPPKDERDDDGPAQVRPFNAVALAARIQFTWACYREREAKDKDTNAQEISNESTGEGNGEVRRVVRTPALFPQEAAARVLAAPDMLPNVRRLAGVVHTPALRADGTLLRTAGYDTASRLLYLPEPGLDIPHVPHEPTQDHIDRARKLILHMLQDFPFVTLHDRAAYIGLLLTPLMRAIAPSPYKQFVISAHQAGSGKTLLAELARIIHGGVFRSEMPDDDGELRKQITTILSETTGPIVHIDNVTGVVRSSTLAGLLTSSAWDDRRLGANELARCVNDRVWVLTGNNMALGGDLIRRSIWINIDPGRPDPQLRSNFAIKDIKGWLRESRGKVLSALLTLTIAWDRAGRPGAQMSSDGYGAWLAAVNGVLSIAGIPGTCDAPEARGQEEGSDDEEWSTFLAALARTFGEERWTARDALNKVDAASATSAFAGIVQRQKEPIMLDELPADLADRFAKLAPGSAPAALARSLGKWLANRRGRWAGGMTVREAGSDKTAKYWRIEVYRNREDS